MTTEPIEPESDPTNDPAGLPDPTDPTAPVEPDPEQPVTEPTDTDSGIV